MNIFNELNPWAVEVRQDNRIVSIEQSGSRSWPESVFYNTRLKAGITIRLLNYQNGHWVQLVKREKRHYKKRGVA